MTSNRMHVTRSIKFEIEKYQARLEDLKSIPIEAIEEDLPDVVFDIVWTGYHIRATLPYDFAVRAEARKVMKRLGWTLLRENQIIWEDSGEAGYFIDFKHPDTHVELDFVFQTTKEGSTCVLHKIGDETKTVPIYEVICAEGAKEEGGDDNGREPGTGQAS
jgi:hypothetical protein